MMFAPHLTGSANSLPGRRAGVLCLVVLIGLAAMAWALPALAVQRLPAGISLTGEPRPVNATTTPKWHAALERHRETVARASQACAGGAPDACALQAWQGYLERLAGKPLWEQLEQVNLTINREPYAHDMEIWGTVDLWAAPQDFFGRGGDCEDYAIAKYFSLRALGVRASDLLLAVVRDPSLRRTHMVLIVLLPDGAVVLDNESDSVLPWDSAGPYRPFYFVNERAALLGVAAR